MTKIDWDKPLRAVDVTGRKKRWEFLTELDGYYWCRPEGDIIAYQFDGDGVNSGRTVQLENIPEEPEREEGWYWINCGEGWTGGAAYWDGVNWSDKCGTLYDHISEWTIGSRVYLDDDFRPAGKFPPPMDGTPFEVEGMETVRVEWHSLWHVISGASVCTSTHDLEWILDKRWRPLQDSQP